MEVVLRLLGSVQLGERVLRHERATYLLTILAVRDTWVTRDELCLLLWSEDTAFEVARMRLRQLLFRVKKLGLAEEIEVSAERLRFVGQSDLQLMKQAFAQADFLSGLAWYQGALLESVAPYEIPEFLTWLDAERDLLRTEMRHATLQAVKQHPSKALPSLERMLRLEPLDQVLLQTALEFPSLAARALEWHQLALKAEGLEPEPSLTPLVQTNQPNWGLPKATSVFWGRQSELEQIAAFWQQPEQRLLSLVGLGGMGKTRLALEVAEQFVGSVVFVSLVNVVDAQQIPQKLLEQLGLSGEDEKTLLMALQNQSLLLILDNLEQVPEVAILIAKILESCPKIRMLCTSRQALGLQAEHVLYLEGLPKLIENTPLLRQPAAQVFLAAAQRLMPHFQLGDQDVEALSSIHASVAGLPLGLELAAGWLRLFTLSEIAQQLQTSSILLSTDAPDVPERQRSFTALFESSWRLLTANEQAALSQLALLRGGFSLEFATRITGVLLPTLLRLVNKSLIRRFDDLFYLHELIRQHAQTYLSQAARQATLDRLSTALLELAKEWSSKSYRQEQTQLSAALEQQHDNLRLVVEDAFLHSKQKAASLVAYSWDFCTSRNYHDQALDWLERALKIPTPDLEVRGLLLIGASYILPQYGRFEESHQAALEIEILYPSSVLYLAVAQRLHGRAALLEQDLVQADQCYTQSCKALFDLDIERFACYSSELAEIKLLRGDLTAAKPLLEQAIGLMRQIGDHATLAQALCSLAEVQGRLGDFGNQQQLLEQAQIFALSVGDQMQLGKIWVALAHNAMAQGQRRQARICLETALRIVWQRKLMTSVIAVLLEVALFEAAVHPQRALHISGGVQSYWRQNRIIPSEQQRHQLESIRAGSQQPASTFHVLELQGEQMELMQLLGIALESDAKPKIV